MRAKIPPPLKLAWMLCHMNELADIVQVIAGRKNTYTKWGIPPRLLLKSCPILIAAGNWNLYYNWHSCRVLYRHCCKIPWKDISAPAGLGSSEHLQLSKDHRQSFLLAERQVQSCQIFVQRFLFFLLLLLLFEQNKRKVVAPTGWKKKRFNSCNLKPRIDCCAEGVLRSRVQLGV